MKNKLIYSLVILCFNTLMFSHSLVLETFDNEDGTMEILGGFNTGAKAEGALLRVESLLSAKILFQKRLPASSSLIIDIPKEPYQIVLDGGPGHQLVQEGSVKPNDGFIIKDSKAKSSELSQTKSRGNTLSTAMITLLTLAFLLLFLTLYFSMKNTNKLIQELKNQQ